ncbi:MAG: hypothetical protein KDA27_28935, partial [Candidatus Eisenbacteria bacterium]|nr:hypothetical protein [Candidatus Eisenbacteria bacterium]
MEAVIVFLLKAVASGITGHYLKKRLEKLDAQLADLFAQGADKDVIAEYIATNQLEAGVQKYAEDAVEDTVIFP